ncbi:MAG: sulfotransferase [Mycobacteriales bacterium]
MRVLFLGGLGRSGTTLLERVLSQLPGVVALGEVVHLWERSLVHDEPCGCGLAFSTCEFWREVGEIAFGGWAEVDTERILALRSSVDRTRYIPRLARGPASADLTEYLSYYQRLYHAAAQVSGASIVLDSSKHASLAFCLRHAPEVDLHVVHCVRDSRAVAYSWTKQVPRPEAAAGESLMKRYPPATSAMMWNSHNAAFSMLRRLGVPTLLLRYEEFVAAPRTTARTVAAFAGAPVSDADLAFLSDSEVDLAVAHTASGNPLRFRTGVVPIRVDNAWRQKFPRLQQRLVTALTLPLLARYGYVRPQGRR